MRLMLVIITLFGSLLLILAGSQWLLRQRPSSFAFVTYANPHDGRYGIYTMWADGSNVRLVSREARGGARPLWSPTGEWIAYQSAAYREESSIYLIRPNGSEPIKLIGSADARWTLRGWSPDGQWVILEENNAGQVSFVRVHRVTGLQERITERVTAASPVSPDGEWTLYESNGNIYRIRQDGTGRQRLTNNTPPTYINEASWSPLIDLPYQAWGLLLTGLICCGLSAIWRGSRPLLQVK